MSFEVLVSSNFKKEAKRLSKKYPSLKNEIRILAKNLKENPEMGTSLGGDIFKIRMAIQSKGRGKSAGARVITFVLFPDFKIFLLSIYDKSEQSSISLEKIKSLISEELG
ncbi:RelE toxin of RelEB toxin-antitoxin system [Algoriphagus aquaeductus]|uniref:RelE toxin of RelEB toxin-antitoxin system n=1 Tax=Algoriphagus aquaeductus TaxID=475299 RepID=A0A326S374_9BACT|nr:type II toxin-antitoxin system RelE/ParE family toxin [Algoriphagus aquaeductus]PZV84383.1 RelE toxin of RelEB toxin-antitoxin system [Algoriphagus aquaeductus]